MEAEREAAPLPTGFVDPTDPGYDVDVLRNHVGALERRIRDLHREKNEAADQLQQRLREAEEVLAGLSEALNAYGTYPQTIVEPQRRARAYLASRKEKSNA